MSYLDKRANWMTGPYMNSNIFWKTAKQIRHSKYMKMCHTWMEKYKKVFIIVAKSANMLRPVIRDAKIICYFYVVLILYFINNVSHVRQTTSGGHRWTKQRTNFLWCIFLLSWPSLAVFRLVLHLLTVNECLKTVCLLLNDITSITALAQMSLMKIISELVVKQQLELCSKVGILI